VDRYETWIDDVRRYLDALPDGSPVILMGISWGGLLATAVTRRAAERISGLGFLCPGFFSRKGTSKLQHQAVGVACGLGWGGRRFPVPLRAPALFTESPTWQRYIRDDPFTLRRVTLRLATASAALYADTVAKPVAVETPTLLMLAGRDVLIRGDQVKRFAQRYMGNALTIQEYPQAAHTLEFEEDCSAYLRDLSVWCRSIATGPSGPSA
jgi:pimeloyl-ACP methyl ester carboxylesterase